MAIDLKKPLGSGGAKTPSRNKLPVKRSINLAVSDEKPINLAIAVPAIAVIIVLAFLLSKFAVVDRLTALSDAQSAESQMQSRVDNDYAAIAAYGDLSTEYAHYTYEEFNDDELVMQDRVDVMELINDCVLPYAAVSSWSLVANQLTLNLNGITLDEVSSLSAQLEERDMVRYCSVSTAVTEDDINGNTVTTAAAATDTTDTTDADETAAEGEDGLVLTDADSTMVFGSQIVRVVLTVYLADVEVNAE